MFENAIDIEIANVDDVFIYAMVGVGFAIVHICTIDCARLIYEVPIPAAVCFHLNWLYSICGDPAVL